MKHKILERTAHLVASKEKLSSLIADQSAIKHLADQRASRSTSLLVWTGLATLTAQWGLMFHLTYVAYSWDVTEPIAFFLQFGTGILGYMFYCITRKEYTYECMSQLHLTRVQRRSYDRFNFDFAGYMHMQNQLESLQQLLQQVRYEYGLVDSPAPTVLDNLSQDPTICKN
jgi:hypothetical protein